MTLPADVEAAIVAHALRERPAECCGLLLGTAHDVLEAVPTQNAATDPSRRYLVEPSDYFRAIRRARGRGVQVIGVYHSHPRSPAMPSATDRAEAFAHFIFVIVGLVDEPPQVTAWTWADGNFNPLPIVR